MTEGEEKALSIKIQKYIQGYLEVFKLHNVSFLDTSIMAGHMTEVLMTMFTNEINKQPSA